MSYDLVIIGGGVAGLTLARTLQDRLKVLVIEESSLGGLSTDLGCKATDECLYCGICQFINLQRELAFKKFDVLEGRIITFLEKSGNGFQIKTENGEKITGQLLAVATGAAPLEIKNLSLLGGGKFTRVYSGWDIERGLNKGVISSFRDFSSLAFIQCAGSRNFKEKRGYCSQVCCRYALRIAENLKFSYPQLNIDFYYMDLQILGKKKEKLWEIAHKINLIRHLPYEIKEEEGKLSLVFEEQGVERKNYDAVILSVGMIPSPGTQKMGKWLGLNFDSNGFIKSYGEGHTSCEGVFVCGTACGPKDIEATQEEAQMVGEEIWQVRRG